MARPFARTCSRPPAARGRSVLAPLVVAATVAGVAASCVDARALLTETLEARRLAAELHVEFTRATDAANRAVMADTDDASAAAAEEARRARKAAERALEALRPLLQDLGYGEDLGFLDGFTTQFDEYRRLDDEILPLAVENTNLKAQRLSFGPAREASDAFRASLEAAVRSGTVKGSCCAEALAVKAVAAVLEIQVVQAAHIAEPEDAVMTRLEAQMAASDGSARQALRQLGAALKPAAEHDVAAAGAALERFKTVNQEIVGLSRRNTNVRSLALSLGRKRVVTAECDDQLRALEQALAKHGFEATR